MFTGIITHTGSLIKKENSIYTFKTSPSLIKKLDTGTSIAIDGACLTVSKIPSKNSFAVEAMPETLKKTTLGTLKVDDIVNLELPATPSTFISGHIVQGHVDGVGTVTKIKGGGNSRILTISFPKDLKKYIVSKGSVAINGVSLTVIKSSNNSFTVGIIPYTWEHTMFHQLKASDQVNIEVDILAKYLC